jgi:hypothetical protein
MIVSQEVAKPHSLGFDREGADIRNRVSDLGLWKHYADPDLARIVPVGSIRD